MKTVRYNLMKVLCEHENQKQKIFIVNYFYFQAKQFELKVIFMLN